MRFFPRSARGAGALVFASYLAVFAALCAPWLQAARHAIPSAGSPADVRLLTWILWWVARSLQIDPSRILDAPFNYPVPAQLTGSEHFASAQLVFLPVYAATGNPILGINAVLFLAYPLAAFAMNRLLRALGFDALVAWTIGFGFALGAVQVPADVHNLHVFAVYPALVALTLRRMRDDPRPLRAAAFAAVFLLALFASYYTAAIVLVVLVLWVAFEAARPEPKRAQFLATAVAIVAASLLLLVIVSLPYLSRGQAEEPTAILDGIKLGTVLNAHAFAARPAHFLGGVSLGLGAAGLAGLLVPRWRWASLLGVLLVAASAFIVLGGNRALLELAGSGPLADVLTFPVRFFRNLIRLSVIASLGLALLGAVALQIARLRLPRELGLAAVAICAVAIAYERGSLLFHPALDTSAALTVDAPVYVKVKQIAAREGRGPLLELPLGSKGFPLQADAMLGNALHELPLLTGWTGYPPLERGLVDENILQLPSEEAVQELVDMTHLRWILLRPASFWESRRERSRFARQLLRIEGVGPEHRIGQWSLIGVKRPVRHPEWFDTLARGAAPGRSLLGAPLDDVAAKRTASRIELLGKPSVVKADAGSAKLLAVRVTNDGEATWPVLREGRRALPGGMSLVARWRSLDPGGDARPSEGRRQPLPRDVPPGESDSLAVVVAVPEVPGRYALELALEQLDRAALPEDTNPPLELVVEAVTK